jgi:4-hydroxythreonine-4-phosphate dehydrogenase
MITVALTLGDVTGVGPEVALKALARVVPEDDVHYVIIGDRDVATYFAGLLGAVVDFPTWEPGISSRARVSLLAPCPPLESGLSAGDESAARAAVEWIAAGARGCMEGRFQALVTGPVNKAAILNAGHPFTGQTEFLAKLAGGCDVAMMLLGPDDRDRWLRVALATTHLPLSEVPGALTTDGLISVFKHASNACRQLGLPRHRIGVCGLNPHAGESGHLGHEEIDLIEPAIRMSREQGLDIHGPFAADTLFHQAINGRYEIVVAMYHDQGLAPLKLVAFDRGVNWTLGLPFIRTSPDHGTACDIAGQGVADESSMVAALRLARDLAMRTIGDSKNMRASDASAS